MVSAASYLLASKDDQVRAVTFLQKLKEEKGEGLHHQAEETRQKYELPEDLLPIRCPNLASKAQHKTLLTEAQKGSMVEKLTKKVHHGPHARETRGQGVDRKATHAWVREGKMTLTTEALVMVAQDDVVMTRDYLFMRSSCDHMCRLCGAYKESQGHLLSKCKVYEHKEYRRRHDAVLRIPPREASSRPPRGQSPQLPGGVKAREENAHRRLHPNEQGHHREETRSGGQTGWRTEDNHL